MIPMIDNVRIMPRGQVTIPKEVQSFLKVTEGDRLTLICKDDYLIVMNPALFALKEYQEAMTGEAEKAGFYSDDDVVDFIMKMRREEGEI